MSPQPPDPTTPAPLPTDSSAHQPRSFKIAAFLLAAVIIVGGTLLYLRHRGQPVTILLDGRPIAHVSNAAAADRLLLMAEEAKVGGGFPEASFVRLQKVQLESMPAGTPLDSDNTAKIKLMNALKLNVHAYAIVVDGHTALGLPTDDAATDTLHRVKEHFAQMPPNADLVGEPAFVEKVAIKARAVSASVARSSAASAAAYFWTPLPNHKYVVRRGDTGLRIALNNHISLSDLIAANPGSDINRLIPGRSINIDQMPLQLSVEVKKKFTREQKVLANVRASEAGRQQVTYVVTYVNGQETHRDPVGIVTLEAPEARSYL